MAKSRGQQGTLKQLPNGRWQASYRQGGRGATKRKKTHDTKTQANAWLRAELDTQATVDAGNTSPLILRRNAGLTVEAMVERYMGAYEGDPATVRVLNARLRKATTYFAGRLASSVEPYEVATWRKTLPPGYAFDVFRALRQVYIHAAAWDWVPRDPMVKVHNPRPRRPEVQIPTWENIAAIRDEIDERYAALVTVAALGGLRVEELLGLERRDVDYDGRVLRVRRVYSSRALVELGPDGRKTRLQRRNVPLRQVVIDALREMPKRLDTPLLFPAPRGGHMDSEQFRVRYWTPACAAAGLAEPVEHQRTGKEAKRPWVGWRPLHAPKDLRHFYASEALASGAMSLLALSRRMGTSLAQIDATYGHLLDDADATELRVLDAWDVAKTGEHRR